MEPIWRIELLGGVRAVRAGHLVNRFHPHVAGALLAYLARHGDRTHPREEVIGLFWPEELGESGRKRLSVALSGLRQQLEPPGVPDGAVIVADRFAVGLNPEAVTTDLREYQACVRGAPASKPEERLILLQRAAELYRGRLGAGYENDWIVGEQREWEERQLSVLRQLSQACEELNRGEEALRYAQQVIRIDNLRDEGYREVIRLQLVLQNPAAALRQYRELEQVLREELGTAPAAATRSLIAEVEPASGNVEATPNAGLSPAPARSPTRISASPAEGPKPGSPFQPAQPADDLHPAGGAEPLDSPFYVERSVDIQFHRAVSQRHCIVLLKGPRQVGKTSLLARGLQRARQVGTRVVHTNLQAINGTHLESAETLLRFLARSLSETLELERSPSELWDDEDPPNINFQRFMRRAALPAGPLVWGLDEVDRLLDCPFRSEVFALFRSWHNERALDPSGPWHQLTLAMAYASEAHLFISDMNQSPFNVGTQLVLEGFSFQQVEDLNRRYGNPLPSEAELERFYRLVGGHPYLVRCGLFYLTSEGLPLQRLEAAADTEHGPYGDHLRRLRTVLERDPALCDALREVIAGRPCPDPDRFYRLRSAGVVLGETPTTARPRCLLYATYLEGLLS